MRPNLNALWAAFPDHDKYPTLCDLYTMFGGVAALNIGRPGFPAGGNTCASRMSHALNHGGAPVSWPIAKSIGVETLGTGDHHRVIVKVAHLRRYLIEVFGKPELDRVRPFDVAFKKKKGIVAFTVAGWGDASGHIALARNGHYREPVHDNYASYVHGNAHTVLGEFWVLD